MIISRYITREILTSLFAVTLVILLAFLSQQMVRYLNFVAIGKIPTSILLELISFEVPYLLAILLPLCLYIAILLAYGRLHVDNEIAIMQMSGYGNKRLCKLTAFIALGVAAVVLALMLVINPCISLKRQQVMASDQAAIHLVQTMMPGRFTVSPDGKYVMYVEKLSRDREKAQNVFLAQEKKNTDNPEQNAWTLVLADQGYQTHFNDSPDEYFVTANGFRYEGLPGKNDYKITQFKTYAIHIPPNDVHISHQENESLTTGQLWDDYQNPKRAAELQWRFSIALSTILLALLAVPLSAVKPRQGRYIALIPAVLIYIVYIQLLFIARRWVEQGSVPVMIGMWWVHGLILGLLLTIMYFSFRKWK